MYFDDQCDTMTLPTAAIKNVINYNCSFFLSGLCFMHVHVHWYISTETKTSIWFLSKLQASVYEKRLMQIYRCENTCTK